MDGFHLNLLTVHAIALAESCRVISCFSTSLTSLPSTEPRTSAITTPMRGPRAPIPFSLYKLLPVLDDRMDDLFKAITGNSGSTFSDIASVDGDA